MDIVPCDDWREFSRFIREAYTIQGVGSPVSDETVDDLASEKTGKDILARQKVLLAKQAGLTFGFAAWRRVSITTAELAGMIVLVPARKKGIGRMLMEKLFKDAAGEGFGRMVVKFDAENEEAASFYTKFGFEKTALVEEWIGDVAVDCIVMERKLVGRATQPIGYSL